MGSGTYEEKLAAILYADVAGGICVLETVRSAIGNKLPYQSSSRENSM